MFPHITNKLTIQAENSAQWKGKKINHLCDQIVQRDPCAKRDGRPQVNPLFNFYALLFDSPPKALASESQVPPQQSNHIMILSEKDLARTKCIEECIRRHQMVAIGMDMIEAGCRKECKLKEAVCLFKSHDKDDRIKDIRMLCEIHDKKAVSHLVKALKWEF